MNRRGLLKQGVLAASVTGGIFAMPAVARSQPAVTWKLASIFPKTLDVQFSTTETIARIASELTDGNFQIQIFAAGEIVPPLQILDAVQAGTVQAGHTALYYAIGKDPDTIEIVIPGLE
jgi:TRAP-type mannitol/chloroaromatic compound transport system substrate-binding protein